MADGGPIKAALERVEAELDAISGRLTAEARLPASAVEHCSTVVVEAHASLAAALDGPAADDAVVRLDIVRTAVRVKRKLQVAARLVAGSAWYAALAKELDGDADLRNKATYGRRGATAPAAAPPSIERRA